MEVSSTTKEISKVLQGVCAYVEVRSKCENRSKVIAEELRKLGADINEKLNVNVTHVVFKDGTNRTWERAKKLNIPLVSVLWVDSCKKTLEHVNESVFCAEFPNKDQEEKLKLFPVKRTKFRSMQPKNLIEEFEESSQRCQRRRKRKDKNKILQNSYSSEPALSPITPCSFDMMPHITTPPSMKAKLLELSKFKDKDSSSAEEDTDDIKRNLFNNADNTSPYTFQTPLSHSNPTSPISCQRNFSDILSSNLLPELPCTMNQKEKSKSFGHLSDLKPSSENLSNSRRSCNVNNQRTVSQDSWRENSQVQKHKSECDSTNNHQELSKPLSAISANTCNLSMEDFIINKPVHRKRYKHRETMNVLGVNESLFHGIKHTTCNSEPSKKADMSQAKHTESTTVPQTLSFSNAEVMTCHKNLKENGASFSSTSADKDNVCTQSNVEERLQQELDCLKTDGITFDNISQSSSRSQVFPAELTSVLLAPVSENLSIIKEKNFPTFQKPIKKYLVMTSMSSSEQEMAKSVTKALGGCVISDNVRKSTTHVICGNARRTLNLLYGLIQGCWLVSKQWVFKSMEAGKWIDERKFEMTDDYPAAKVYRQNKQRNRSLPIFESCGPMFISTSSAPPRKDLVHFVQFCGGQVKNTMCNANFYVGEEFNPSMLSVSPQWILDSITHQKACPLERYQLGQPKPPSPEY